MMKWHTLLFINCLPSVRTAIVRHEKTSLQIGCIFYSAKDDAIFAAWAGNKKNVAYGQLFFRQNAKRTPVGKK